MLDESKREAIQAIIDQIDVYEGETIVKQEHPLWLAVVRLEGMYPTFRRSAIHRLPYPAAGHWYRGLWASREGMGNVPIEFNGPAPYAMRNKLPTNADPELAKAWILKLRETLCGWLERNTEEIS